MQGPRFLSHHPEGLVTVQRPEPESKTSYEDGPELDETEPSRVQSKKGKVRRTTDWLKRHLHFLGPGLIASAA